MKFLTSKAFISLGFFILFYLICYFINIKIAIIASIILIIFLFIYDQDNLILLYTILLPTNGAVKNDFYLLGFLNFDLLVYILTIYILIKRSGGIKENLSGLQKFSIYMILIFLVYTSYTAFKDAAFGLYEMDYKHAFLRTINYTLKLFPLILVIKLLQKDIELKSLVFTGIPVGIIIVCFTMFFASHLDLIGFKTANLDIETTVNFSIIRTSGIFANGDKNSLGVFLVMFVGFLVSLIEKRKIPIYYMCTLIIAVYGIFHTVSRTAIISLIFVLFIFLLRGSILTFLKVCILTAFVIVIFPKSISPIIERFQYSEKELDYTNSSSRVGKWILYLKHIKEEPNILLIGNTYNLYLSKWAATKNYLNASHNLYIEMVYRGGIMFFVLIFALYSKFFVNIYLNRIGVTWYYYLIPFLFITFYTPDWGSFYYLGFYLNLNNELINENEL